MTLRRGSAGTPGAAQMKWVKRGIVIRPGSAMPWAHSHAMLPVAQVDGGRGIRVYYAARDLGGRSHVVRTQVDLDAAQLTVDVPKEPELIVGPGPLGGFDDSGATCSALVSHRGRLHLFYSGWSLGRTVPFYIFIGCAVSEDGGKTFVKVSPSPIVDRSRVDPFLAGHPSVLIDSGVWRMWYASGTGWTIVDGLPRHHYHIKYAESSDGLEWRRTGKVCIDYAGPEEYALGRPFVVRDRDAYRMWYSRRGAAYRIGYAESTDGLDWRRRDDAVGIDASPAGWDSEMVAYPCVFDVRGRRWMLYNGNGYGRTGIGLAELGD